MTRRIAWTAAAMAGVWWICAFDARPQTLKRSRHQEAGLVFLKNFTTDDYGAEAQNWAVTQDSRGVIYVGNNSGVLEYDGYEW
ncbi:MAG: hypothetical protein RMM53_12060, partial [Bacteroidia bacterium]|nr:hypothetical protein [Bacteroidia bacterium]MDW8334940.1 hypothetical protein [Bacteroidia bacterium]